METATIATLQARVAMLEDLILRLPMTAWGDSGARLAAFPALQSITERKRQRESDSDDADEEESEQLRNRLEGQNSGNMRARLTNTGNTAEELQRQSEPSNDGSMVGPGFDADDLTGGYEHTGPAKVVTEVSTPSIHQNHMQ